MTSKKRKLPSNLDCWRFTLKRPEQVNSFLERGNKKQHKQIRDCLEYLKTREPEFFEKIDGKLMLKKFRKKLRENNYDV